MIITTDSVLSHADGWSGGGAQVAQWAALRTTVGWRQTVSSTRKTYYFINSNDPLLYSSLFTRNSTDNTE